MSGPDAQRVPGSARDVELADRAEHEVGDAIAIADQGDAVLHLLIARGLDGQPPCPQPDRAMGEPGRSADPGGELAVRAGPEPLLHTFQVRLGALRGLERGDGLADPERLRKLLSLRDHVQASAYAAHALAGVLGVVTGRGRWILLHP